MVRGYLLDTNIVAYWFDEKSPEHVRVTERATAHPDQSPHFISAVTLGEIEYGHKVESGEPTSVQVKFMEFLQEQDLYLVEIGRSTAAYYGSLRASLFDKYAPKKGRKRLRLEQLIDPVTSPTLGIQENDLWIAAQAIEHNIVLVTHDRLDHIRTVAGDVLGIEDWAG